MIFVVLKSSVSAGVWSLTQVMPREPGAGSWELGAGSQGSSPQTVGLMTLRDGEQSLELQPGELPGVYELGEEADNYLYQCITSGLISRAYHSRGLKITDRERQSLFANIVNTRRCNACPSVCFGEFYLDWSLYFIFLSLSILFTLLLNLHILVAR